MSLQLAPLPDHSILLTVSSGKDDFGSMLKRVGESFDKLGLPVEDQTESEKEDVPNVKENTRKPITVNAILYCTREDVQKKSTEGFLISYWNMVSLIHLRKKEQHLLKNITV